MKMKSLVKDISLLSLNELIKLQYEIIKQIEMKVNLLEARRNLELGPESPQGNPEEDVILNNTPKNTSDSTRIHATSMKRENDESFDIVEDSQDFVLTQISSSLMESQKSIPNPKRVTDDEINVIVKNASSPLKDDHDFDKTHKDLRQTRSEIPFQKIPQYQSRLDLTVEERELLNQGKSHSYDQSIKIPSEPILPKPSKTISKLNFNFNPITMKPWILEDFKPNNDTTSVSRGRRKLEAFYSKVGKPGEVPVDSSRQQQSTNNKHNSNYNNDVDFDFDNLRNRSKSPPGYGRMDFPSTQERNDDKIKSQKRIYEKTLYRFKSATNFRIPPYEREFLFKKDVLNRVVDDNNFDWNRENLKIFLRSK